MAYEFIVRKSNGQMISIVQSNELHLRVGDQVLLSTVNGTTRIRQQLESYPY
jgi:outer membrane lipoprotein SlyB